MKVELHDGLWECHECGAKDVQCYFVWFDNLCQHFVSLCVKRCFLRASTMLGGSYYRFVGKNSPVGGFRIPYGAIVRCLKWFPRRRVLIEYDGKVMMTMGYLLRKIKDV